MLVARLTVCQTRCMGRHSASDDDDDVDVPLAELGTRGDLQLLHEDPAVRARCIAAVLVPFALYTVAMIAMGAASDFAVWVWIPIVVAGIGVGFFLDLGYRSLRRPSDDVNTRGRHSGSDGPVAPGPPGSTGLHGQPGRV
jgi:hypothetical protein